MTRPFGWRDLPWLYRMRHRMLILDSRRAYTHPPLMLHDLLFNHGDISNAYCRLVEYGGQARSNRIVGQLCHRPGHRHARLSFIGPEDRLDQPGTTALLEGLISEAGLRGAHMLVADVDEDNPVFEHLRRAGFAIFARQRIWHSTAAPLEIAKAFPSLWRTASPGDRPAMQRLYASLVPPLVQQIDPAPFTDHHAYWVHWRGDALLGILDVTRGPLGVRLQPFFHPEVQSVRGLVTNFLAHYRPTPDTALFVCVRSYQGGIGLPLQDLGFSPCCDQAVMVRRLTAAVHENSAAMLPTLDGKQAEASAPISRYDG